MDWVVKGHPSLRGPRELEVQPQKRHHIHHRLSLSSKLNCIPPNPSCKPPKLSYRPRRNACAPLRMSSNPPERSSKPPGGSSELTFSSCTLGLIAFHQGLGIQRLVAVTHWTPRRLWCAYMYLEMLYMWIDTLYVVSNNLKCDGCMWILYVCFEEMLLGATFGRMC